MSERRTIDVLGRDLTRRSVEADGLTIRYWTSGGGQAPLWVRGPRGPRFLSTLDRLAPDCQVNMAEFRGFGDSDLNARTATPAEMATTFVPFIRSAGLAPTTLWDISVGGLVATHEALDPRWFLNSLSLEAPDAFRRSAQPPGDVTPEEFIAAFNSHADRVTYRRAAPPDPTNIGASRQDGGSHHAPDLNSASIRSSCRRSALGCERW